MPKGFIDAAFATTAVFVCLLSWLKGGAPERWGATLIALAWGLVLLAQRTTKNEIPIGWVMVADILLATGFLVVALRYSSLWLGAAMMFQGAEIAGHAAFMGGWTGKFAYVTWLDAMSGLVLLSIFGGTLASMYVRAVAARAPH